MHPIAELSKVAREFHHVQGEHEREGVAGSWRRRMRARMQELEQRFETLLQRWVPGVAEQAQWREHLHRGAEEPREQLPIDEPPLYRGRSAAGAELVIRAIGDEHEWIIDGNAVARGPLRGDIGVPVHYGGSQFEELFEAPPQALEALLDHADNPAEPPPWAWARALYDDGLIDENFGLTERGRRYRAQQRR